MHSGRSTFFVAAVLHGVLGCGSSSDGTAPTIDAGRPDVAVEGHDAHVAVDAGKAAHDAGGKDTGPPDARHAVDTGTTSLDAATDAPLDAPVGAPQPPPQVVDLGGAVLTSPKIQLITYAEDPLASDANAFVTEFGATSEWASQTTEYGVGAFTQLPMISIPGTPPTTLDDNTGTTSPFQQTLAANTSGADPVWGAADPSTIYLFVLPAGTNISSGGSCCTDFLGYHYEAVVGSVRVPYAVVCDCQPGAGDPTTALEYVTTTESHELVEATTDPFPRSNPAYPQADDADFIWTYVTGGEVADMCEYNLDSNYAPPGSTYEVQRSWSNAAAAAGTNPCVPVPSTGPYFNSYAVYDDTVAVSYYGQPLQTTGVKIAVGATRTIDVVLKSNGATSGPWTVRAWDESYYLGGTANTTTALDVSTGSDGDVLHLTIQVNSYDSNLGGAGILLESTLNGQDNLTMFAIGS